MLLPPGAENPSYATAWAEKWGGELLCSFLLGELGPGLTQCDLDRGLPPYQVASWSIHPFGHNTPTSQTDRQTDRQTESPDRQDRTDNGPLP